MVGALRGLFSHTTYNAQTLGFSSSAKTGLALGLALSGASALLDDEQKKKLANRIVSFYRQTGIKEENISSDEIKKALSTSIESTKCVVASSPLFYFVFNAIHKSKLPLGHHLFTAGIKGFTGTLACIPAMLVFYAGAAYMIPCAENALMRQGLSKKQAHSRAEEAIILGLGSPLEFYIETRGCGITTRLPFLTTAAGTLFVAGRLATGVLVQYRALDETSNDEHTKDSSRKYTDLLKSAAGTTVTQHLLNGTVQSIRHNTGVKSIISYVKSGDVTDNNLKAGGLRQLAGTFVQRILFTYAWNELTHQNKKTPEWVKA